MAKKKTQKLESPSQSPPQEDAKEQKKKTQKWESPSPPQEDAKEQKKKTQKWESPSQSPPQEDTKEQQLVSLRTVNNLLVRETVERRKQIDSLKKSKDALETELAEAAAKVWDLKAEKSACLDRVTASEVEQGIFAMVIASELGRLKEEVKGKVEEAEVKRAMVQTLKSTESEREELVARVAVLDARVADSLREKEETERALAEKETKIRDLWKEIDGVREDLGMHKEELRSLRLAAEDLEKSNAEGREKNKQLQMERDGLAEEKIEMDKRFEALKEDRDSVQRRLQESSQRFSDLKKEMSDTMDAMDDVRRAWAAQGDEMSEMQKEAGKLNAELQLGREALDVVLHERDAAAAELVRRKEETERLMLKVLELEQSNAAIKRAFEIQSRLAEDSKAELTSLQMTAIKLQEKKNFWTWFSSAATIVAAASVAFIARGRH